MHTCLEETMFEQFIKERENNPNPSPSDLKSFVIRMRQNGLKPSSCNNRIRAVNAYLQWSQADTAELTFMTVLHLFFVHPQAVWKRRKSSADRSTRQR
jgi:hypothetical protein